MSSGVVKFWCYSNTDNNDQSKSSEAYRFLKDTVVNAVEVYLRETNEHSLGVQFACGCPLIPMEKIVGSSVGDDQSVADRSAQYVAHDPIYTLDRLIVNPSVMDELLKSVGLLGNQDLIFEKWGLKQNSPHHAVALNFYGDPGTGKSLAAHAIASFLGKKIILASYAGIESMYHGEGPKNVEAIFSAAERQGAVLFIDEADSLLSKRLTNVQQGSEQAINSMRSQILICLEKFSGVVIFATNLVSNYDRAFESRIRSIEFALPDEERRRKIWAIHLPKSFPVDSEVTPDRLAKIEDVSGRDIRNTVQSVAEWMVFKKCERATLAMFTDAIDRIKKSRYVKRGKCNDVKLTKEERKNIAAACNDAMESNPRIRKALSANPDQG